MSSETLGSFSLPSHLLPYSSVKTILKVKKNSQAMHKHKTFLAVMNPASKFQLFSSALFWTFWKMSLYLLTVFCPHWSALVRNNHHSAWINHLSYEWTTSHMREPPLRWGNHLSDEGTTSHMREPPLIWVNHFSDEGTTSQMSEPLLRWGNHLSDEWTTSQIIHV